MVSCIFSLQWVANVILAYPICIKKIFFLSLRKWFIHMSNTGVTNVCKFVTLLHETEDHMVTIHLVIISSSIHLVITSPGDSSWEKAVSQWLAQMWWKPRLLDQNDDPNVVTVTVVMVIKGRWQHYVILWLSDFTWDSNKRVLRSCK